MFLYILRISQRTRSQTYKLIWRNTSWEKMMVDATLKHLLGHVSPSSHLAVDGGNQLVGAEHKRSENTLSGIHF